MKGIRVLLRPEMLCQGLSSRSRKVLPKTAHFNWLTQVITSSTGSLIEAKRLWNDTKTAFNTMNNLLIMDEIEIATNS
jgi:hypothetical protein